VIFLDFETRSNCVIQDTGTHRYAEDPSTDVLCTAWAVDKGPVELWVPGEAFPIPIGVLKKHNIEAHYVGFECAIWKNVMVRKYGWPEVPEDKWRCSSALGASYALPRDLKRVAIALNLPVQKDMDGKRIMMKLSRPRTKVKNNPAELWNHPAHDFRKLYEYCRNDVETERAIHYRLRPLPALEQEIWALDQRINERGVRVDMPAVNAALRFMDVTSRRLLEEFKKITGLDSPGQIAKFLKWIETQGIRIKTLTKNDVIALLAERDLSVGLRRALEIRQSLAKTSTAKYEAVRASICKDGRLRGLLMYHGASTGRWTGQLVQPQNFPKNTFKGDLNTYFEILKRGELDAFELCYPDVMHALSKTIRGIFIPSEGHVFFGGDYSAIEARVLFWLAGEKHGLAMFRENQDIYKDLAATIHGVPFEKVTKEQRELGKRGILGAGYGMGKDKFRQTCWDFARIRISEELAERAITAYRGKYYSVFTMWRNQEMAALEAVRTRKAVRCGKVTWGVHDGFLFCKLPSGRCLAYYDPKIEIRETPWGEKKDSVTYMTINPKTKEWMRDHTYGGKITENLCQAVARDIMAEAMLRCEEAGFKVVLSVHDELLTETEYKLKFWKPKDHIVLFEILMARLPAWAEGLPIKAEGWTGDRYVK